MLSGSEKSPTVIPSAEAFGRKSHASSAASWRAQPVDQRPLSEPRFPAAAAQSGAVAQSLPAEDADDGPPVPRPELHEIAVLVHVPQPIVCIGGNRPTVQQIIDGRIVRDLAGHRVSVTPDPDRHTRCATTQTPPRQHLRRRRHPGSPVDRQPSHVQLELGVADQTVHRARRRRHHPARDRPVRSGSRRTAPRRGRAHRRRRFPGTRPASTMTGWLRCASSITGAARVSASYGQISHKGAAGSIATFRIASCS